METYKELKKQVSKAIDSADEFLKFKEKMLDLNEGESFTVNIMNRTFIIMEVTDVVQNKN